VGVPIWTYFLLLLMQPSSRALQPRNHPNVTESKLRGRAIYIVQSKFYDAFERGRTSALSIAHYQQFDAMPAVFRDAHYP